MTRINLLPWRDELREERKKAFFQSLLFVLIVAGGLLFLAGTVIDGNIETQNARNARLQEEIRILDTRISEIRSLEQQRRDLLARMEVIQNLQGNRPVIVRIFDELVQTLADGVFYTSLRVAGSNVSLEGVAETNARVSALMRNLDGSDWFVNPNLRGLREAPEFGSQASRFTLTVTQTLPRDAQEE